MTRQTEAVTMWFDRRLVMRKSPIQGSGTFITDAVSAGEQLMWVSGGVVYTSEDWRTGRVQLDGELYNEDKIGDDLFVATPLAIHYYINHSCEPNMLNGIAWRDIMAGEEITTDYGLAGGASLEACRCGSPLCRGRISNDDWQLPELQARYRGFFPPHLERRIQQIGATGNQG